MVSDEIGCNQSPANLAKTFFDLSLDPYFRSTITEARLYMALYKNFQHEIDENYMNYYLSVNIDKKEDATDGKKED